MTFQDIFKSSFLENVSQRVPAGHGTLALVLAFGLGLFIFLIYKKTFAGVMYSSSFGVTLVALTMITTLVILAVTSNVVLSLGMVGALSIVRFRAAIKEPLDIAFLFWSIAAGHCAGGGHDPPGGDRQRGHRSGASGVCQSEIPPEPLHCSAALPGLRPASSRPRNFSRNRYSAAW